MKSVAMRGIWSLRDLKRHRKTTMLKIKFAGEEWMLTPQRAMVWPRRKTLILADTHFGKASLFREAGVPVPKGTTSHDLTNLTGLIEAHAPERLLVLGDFFHGKAGRQDSTISAISHWRNRFGSLAIEVIRGNHDRHAGDPCNEWNMTCLEGPVREGAVAFCHEPREIEQAHVICGHVHPAVTLADFDGSKTKIPCFFAEEKLLILPAFGRFTGTHPMKQTETSRIYMAAAGKVILLPSRRIDGTRRSSSAKQRDSKIRRDVRDPS
jgi:DNA ligase-associated metallophosphoesterase